jgi:hypothetical protein
MEGPVTRDGVKDLALEAVFLELIKMRGEDLDDKAREWILKAYLATKDATAVEAPTLADDLTDEQVTEALRERINPKSEKPGA